MLRHHNRAAYSSQVIRHVAEQIYELYWDSGEPELDVEDQGLMTLERGADLKDHTWVNSRSVPNHGRLTAITGISWSSRMNGQITRLPKTVGWRDLLRRAGQHLDFYSASTGIKNHSLGTSSYSRAS